MKLLDKVVSFETKGELRDWFNQGSASAPRIEIMSTDPIMKNGKEVWQTRVCLTGHDAPMILQSRIGQAFLHIRKEFPKHTIGVTDRAYNKIKFYDPEYRAAHPYKRPEKTPKAPNTAIADALALAQEKKRRGLRQNSMTSILVDHIKNHGGVVSRKDLAKEYGDVPGAILTRAVDSGLVQKTGRGLYIHRDNAPVPQAVINKPKKDETPATKRPVPYEAEALKMRIRELEAENTRLKKALVALTG